MSLASVGSQKRSWMTLGDVKLAKRDPSTCNDTGSMSQSSAPTRSPGSNGCSGSSGSGGGSYGVDSKDLVGNLTAQYQGNGMASSSMSGMSMGNGMAQQFGNGSGMPQHYGQMGGMGVQPMQQYGGMMNPDGSQGMVAMQQVMMVQSPTGGAMVPQMQMQPGMGQGSQGGTLGALELASAPAAPDTAITSPSAPERESSSATASQEGSNPSKAWDKVRRWKATIPEDERVPVVTCSEPFGPGIGRDAPEDIVVKWLKNGDVVRQTDHSKKMKGYMVMPVRVEASNPFEKEVEGFVTRRSIEKNRDNGDVVWFEEVDGRS